ncbi:hypothetical protein [Chryseobacterium sp. R2A-55]|uniref:hypothetical protein n=1 Tax=Chryseobacterium sp. R2A-55 TaxID=2744445 RepID=UPI001F35D2CC|nr:hypothetical protein [Chryseobacterium sp. R2A-55]
MDTKKKTLVKMAFEQAKKELPRATKTSVAFYLSSLFEEKYGFSKNEKTFSRYYTELIEKNRDYAIDEITLDQLSAYVGYKNYRDFCQNTLNEAHYGGSGSVKISISDEKGTTSLVSEALKIVINNTISLPEFFTKNQNSLGLIGILLLGGLVWNRIDYAAADNKKEMPPPAHLSQTVLPKSEPETAIPQAVAYIPTARKTENIIIEERKQECMYWQNDHYEPAFCDEKISGQQLVAANEDMLRLFRKINAPDTLTVANAIGNVWYDKSDKKVEFFTHYGLNPRTGKTLKPVTPYIIGKYVVNSASVNGSISN